MINIDKVSKSYGKDQVLDEVGLSIDKGKFTAFIGPNGAGKSTLLSLISRLMPKEEGKVSACEVRKQLLRQRGS